MTYSKQVEDFALGRSRDSSSTKIGEKASKWLQVLRGGLVEILLISSIFTMNEFGEGIMEAMQRKECMK